MCIFLLSPMPRLMSFRRPSGLQNSASESVSSARRNEPNRCRERGGARGLLRPGGFSTWGWGSRTGASAHLSTMYRTFQAIGSCPPGAMTHSHFSEFRPIATPAPRGVAFFRALVETSTMPADAWQTMLGGLPDHPWDCMISTGVTRGWCLVPKCGSWAPKRPKHKCGC